MSEERSRKWQITQNNPEKHGINHGLITILLADMKPAYYCMCDEIGEEGTYHTHLFLQFKNAKSFSVIKNCFPSAHIEKAYGTAQENRDYVRKEGKYLNSEKKTTNLAETFEEGGEMIEEKQGKRSDIEDIYSMIKEGSSELEILEKHPQFMNSLSSYSRVKELLMEEESNQFRIVEVVYIWGDTGSGKTRYIAEQFGYGHFCRITDYQHPFDSYNYEDVIVFDEFRSSLPLSDMLNYLDGHPVDLPCRYNNKKAIYTKVFIISNIPLQDQYRDISIDHETAKAFERRISKSLHFRKGKPPEEEEVKFI